MSPGPAGVTMERVTTPRRTGAEPPPRVRAAQSGRFVAGVAGGVADHLGVPVLWVRAAFVVLLAVGGAGVLAYGLLWIFVRQEAADVARHGARGPSASRRSGSRRSGIARRASRAPRAGNSFVGLGRRAARRGRDRRRRRVAGGRRGPAPPVDRGRRAPGCPAWSALWRVIGGRACSSPPGSRCSCSATWSSGRSSSALLAVLATLVGVAVITVPWWLRLVRDLGEERRERIRRGRARGDRRAPARLGAADPRADPAPVRRSPARCCGWPAARSASCGTWLYGPGGYRRPAAPIRARRARRGARGGGRPRSRTPTRSTVRPGGRSATARWTTTCARWSLAAREAMVNAAKHAGVDEVSVYAEVEDGRACTCSSATGARASTPTRCPTTGTGSPIRSAAG